MNKLFALFLFFTTSVHAADLWSPMSDAAIVRQVAITMILNIDRQQTQEMRRRIEAGAPPWVHREGNPILRRDFTEQRIDRYFVLSAIGSAVITKTLPAEWRPAYQWGVLAYQVAVVIHNKHANLSIEW